MNEKFIHTLIAKKRTRTKKGLAPKPRKTHDLVYMIGGNVVETLLSNAGYGLCVITKGRESMSGKYKRGVLKIVPFFNK